MTASLLRTDCLISPSDSDVAEVAAAMLWPGDNNAERRDEYVHAVIFHSMLDSGTHVPLQDMTLGERKAFFESIRKARSPESFADPEALERGLIAGRILYDAIKPMPLREAKDNVEVWYAQFRRSHRKRFSKNTIQQIWVACSPVAHYWAALHVFGEEYLLANPFPCTPDDLGRFLATAELLRLRGETTRAARSREPVLRSGASVRVNPLIKLPRGVLFQPE